MRVRRWHVVMIVAATCLSACKPPPETKPAEPPAAEIPRPSAPALATRLAGVWIDAAAEKLSQQRPDEALALLVSALRTDPESVEAREAAAAILAETTWNFPLVALDHRLPVSHVAHDATSLWVSLAGETQTIVRWNLETLQIESVMFPAPGAAVRSMTFDAGHRWLVSERGGVTLLCDAQTLKPIRELGKLPESLTPAAVISFSDNGLLFAYPAAGATPEAPLVWHLCDTSTGETIRAEEPEADAPAPVAAHIDRQQLRVLRRDGSLWEIPLSPVEEPVAWPVPTRLAVLQAQFAPGGEAALTLQEPSPHQPPVREVVSFGESAEGALEPTALMMRFPWSRTPNVWNGLMAGPDGAPFRVEGNAVKLAAGSRAPVETTSAVSAAAFDANHVVTGEESGVVTIRQWLPVPAKTDSNGAGGMRGLEALVAVENLAAAVAGIRYDEDQRTFSPIAAAERAQAMARCDLSELAGVFPDLDFQPLAEALAAMPQQSASPDAWVPLWDRLARADLGGKSWPKLLQLAKPLENTQWYQQLTASVLAQAAGTASPWLAPVGLDEVFAAGDSDAVLAAIEGTAKSGPAAAAALKLALASEEPEWIAACLEHAADLPPFLRQIGLSRIAWLEGRKADALSPWPEDFPNMDDVRASQDWDGWEFADFRPALADIGQRVTDEVSAITLPENSTEEQRQAVAERLGDAETLATVGKRRFAEACLAAALAFSAHKDDADTTFRLAKSARDLGAPPEPCLRAEALALTAMGDYEKAHPRWIELLTEHPVSTTIPGDYAEAAYTAFENSDPQQAMEILTTGMHRFPTDSNFALRAGWVALLTGSPERAFQFLLTGSRIGYPAEKLENATALLTIAAAKSGHPDDAAVYFQDLLHLDPAWADMATLDTLEWPDDLKSVLLRFIQPDEFLPDIMEPDILLPELTPDLSPGLLPTKP